MLERWIIIICDARAQNPSFIGNYLQRYKQK